jgi:membrane protein DedA with SNARE-associated domain
MTTTLTLIGVCAVFTVASLACDAVDYIIGKVKR